MTRSGGPCALKDQSRYSTSGAWLEMVRTNSPPPHIKIRPRNDCMQKFTATGGARIHFTTISRDLAELGNRYGVVLQKLLIYANIRAPLA